MIKYTIILWVLLLPMSLIMSILAISGAIIGNDERQFVYLASCVISVSHTYMIIMAIYYSVNQKITNTRRTKYLALMPFIHPFTYIPIIVAIFLFLY